MTELTQKEKDILKCAFEVMEDCDECSFTDECDAEEEPYEEGRKLLIKLGVLSE